MSVDGRLILRTSSNDGMTMSTTTRNIATSLLATALLISMSACSLLGMPAPNNAPPPAPSMSAETKPTGTVPVALCVPNEFADGFDTQDILTDGSHQEIADNLVDLLVDAGALPPGIKMLSLEYEEDFNALTIDMNAAYGEAVTDSAGTVTEYAIVGTVANTMLNYFNAHFITITVEGKPLKSNFTSDDGSPSNFFIDQRTNYREPLELHDLPNTIEDLPDPAAIENLYRFISGYWNSNGEFVAFVTHCGKPHIEYGIWNSDYMRSGPVTNTAASGELSVEITFLAEEQPGWEGSDGYPEESITIQVDLSSFAKNAKLKVGADGDLSTFTYAGMNFQEALDASGG